MRAAILFSLVLLPAAAPAQQPGLPPGLGPRGSAIPPPDLTGTPQPAGPIAAPPGQAAPPQPSPPREPSPPARR
ncbi:MAG: hypothetical protein N2Z67_01370 [Acetobacteraceae bacterium]|nr:hypothetical protein [Acetobacteraceae bacterium]